jgi:teichuronic acid biosynthesis glycosyltransferase TuaH
MPTLASVTWQFVRSCPDSLTDVAYTFFNGSWENSIGRLVMPEDRLALSLMRRQQIRRLVVCDWYRSVAGKARATLRGRPGSGFPETTSRSHFAPLRLRRADPVHPERSVARYEARLRRRAARIGLERPAIITANPLLAGFGSFDWAGPVTYYAWDDWAASRPYRRWWDAYHEAFARLRESHRGVCAVSEGIVRRIAPTGPQAVIPNGIDEAEWAELVAAPDWFTSLPAPRLVYVGTLDARVDVTKLEAVSRAFRSGSVVLVGPMIDTDHFAYISGLPNVTVRSWLGRSDIVGILSQAEVCLIPHVSNELTLSMSPLKLFEYLAGGRPVAAVDLPPIAEVDAHGVVLSAVEDDFVSAVRHALDIGPATDAQRRAFISANSWEQRFDDLLELALAG